jgi:hypothetical protein
MNLWYFLSSSSLSVNNLLPGHIAEAHVSVFVYCVSDPLLVYQKGVWATLEFLVSCNYS